MEDLHTKALLGLPMFLQEEGGRRKAVSLLALQSLDTFWTIESLLMRSVEYLIRDAQTELVASSLMPISQKSKVALPSADIVANFDSSIVNVWSYFDIVRLSGHLEERRLDICWAKRGDKRRWIFSDSLADALQNADQRRLLRRFQRYEQAPSSTALPLVDVPVDGLDGYCGVSLRRRIFLTPRSPIAKFLLELWSKKGKTEPFETVIYLETLSRSLRPASISSATFSTLEQSLRLFEQNLSSRLATRSEFLRAAKETGDALVVFDPYFWEQRKPNEDELSISFDDDEI